MKNYYSVENFSQPTITELKKRVSETKKNASSKKKQMQPIRINGRNIVNSWWGVAWCLNLEQYADYASRLERGRRYVRAGTVVDLEIKKGKITAKVQGTRKTPYKVEIRISPLSENYTQKILAHCGGKIDTLESLINGDFPRHMQDVFTGEGGLFPTPREISFSCSCPDWALMCKHVAAALYGVGARLDENPLLFFDLRGLDVEHFIDVALASRVEDMLSRDPVQSSRIIPDDMISDLFGVI